MIEAETLTSVSLERQSGFLFQSEIETFAHREGGRNKTSQEVRSSA
jgi:hypothetical protein